MEHQSIENRASIQMHAALASPEGVSAFSFPPILKGIGWPAEINIKAHYERLDGADGLFDRFLQHITLICFAQGALVMWHPACGSPRIVRLTDFNGLISSNPDSLYKHILASGLETNCSTEATSRISYHEDVSCVTDTIRLNGGAMTFTLLLSRLDPDNLARSRLALAQQQSVLTLFFELWLSLLRSKASEQNMSSAIDHSGVATIVLNRAGEVQFANRAAKALLAERDGLQEYEGRLKCATFSNTLIIQKAINQVMDSEDTDQIVPIIAVERIDRRSLLIGFISSASVVKDESSDSCCVAYIFNPEQDVSESVKFVCQLYALSPSETKLTCALVNGLCLASAAKQLGLTVQTARSYLKQIFAKTETNRQTELVQLMLKSSVQISSAERTELFL